MIRLRRWACGGLLFVLALGGSGALAAAPGSIAAVFIVNSAADVVDASPGNGVCETAPGNNVCTLRAAIQETNALTGTDTVILPALPPGGVYQFSLTGAPEDAAAAGDLDITGHLTLTGGGAGTTIIDANGAVVNDRALHILPGAALTLTGVTVRHGRHTAIGAGLLNLGRLDLSDSVVVSNTLTGVSTSDSGGGLHNNAGAVASLQRTVFQGNQSTGQAGGIWNEGTLTVSASLIASNTAEFSGGGIFTFVGNTTIRDSWIERNAAETGGGFAYAVSFNSTNRLVLERTAVVSNTAEVGGGGHLLSFVTLVARNSTISGNVSAGDGGGLYASTQTTATLMNVTLTGNTAGDGFLGGGIRIFGTAKVFLRNTLLAGNAHRTGMSLTPDDCNGTLTSLDYNLVRTLTNCTVTGPDTPGLLGATPTGLGPLGQHGGPSPTLPLLAGSNLVDAGNPAGCTDEFGAPLLTDQRGFLFRAVDGDGNGSAICDIGAYEFKAASPDIWLPLVRR